MKVRFKTMEALLNTPGCCIEGVYIAIDGRLWYFKSNYETKSGEVFEVEEKDHATFGSTYQEIESLNLHHPLVIEEIIEE